MGDQAAVEKTAADNHFDLSGIKLIDPLKFDEKQFNQLIDKLVTRRKGKTDPQTVAMWLQEVNYFGTMLVYTGKADAMVSGAVHPTGDTVRPALQIIKTAPGVSRISGAFIMQKMMNAICLPIRQLISNLMHKPWLRLPFNQPYG